MYCFFTNPIGQFKPDLCDPKTSVTVFVHGKKGKQDLILRQQGYVIMNIKDEMKKVSINENGQAFFQNLGVGEGVHLNIDFSEPYKSLYPDSTYIIQPNGDIYLAVALEGLNKVHGKVLFDDSPLAGVTVNLPTKDSNFLVTTSVTGDFSIDIPEKMQTKTYKVWFIKDGYKAKSYNAYPETGQPMMVVMEKK